MATKTPKWLADRGFKIGDIVETNLDNYSICYYYYRTAVKEITVGKIKYATNNAVFLYTDNNLPFDERLHRINELTGDRAEYLCTGKLISGQRGYGYRIDRSVIESDEEISAGIRGIFRLQEGPLSGCGCEHSTDMSEYGNRLMRKSRFIKSEVTNIKNVVVEKEGAEQNDF